jgi:hypothetical protein
VIRLQFIREEILAIWNYREISLEKYWQKN